MLFDHCLKGTLVVEEVRSQILEHNPLKDPVLRRIPVYLPPGYHLHDRPLPVVYALKGLFGSSESWLEFSAYSENIFQIADRLIAEGLPPFVLACPDCFTRYGGSQYINSSATGDYADHIVQEVVPQFEQKYHLLGGADYTAAAGRSSGGFGALRLAGDFPEVFHHAASSAGDMYFRMTVIPELARFPQLLEQAGGLDRCMEGIPALKKLDSATATLLNIIALSACYSPSPESPWGFDLPIDPESGTLKPAVFDRWLLQDPVERIASKRESLAGLVTHYLEAGNRDEYHSELGLRHYVSRCRDENVTVSHAVFDGGHFGTTARWEKLFRELSRGFQSCGQS